MKTNLQTVSDSGETFSFDVISERGLKGWHFEVWADPIPSSGEFFELDLIDQQETDSVRIDMIHNHGEAAYRDKCIPEALLPLARRISGRSKLVSSATRGVGTERREHPGQRMWCRLVAK